MPTLMSPQTKIENYLAEFRDHLRLLTADQRVDIVEEIRSHIRDAAAADGEISEASLSAALDRLGPPSALAASYVTDTMLAQAQRSHTPWTILRAVFQWATLSVKGFLVFSVCLIGYALGASFFIVALIRPFNHHAGLWLIDQDTFSLVLGFTDASPRGHELLGWTIIPIGMAFGGGTIMLTTYFASRCIRRYRATRAAMKSGATAP